MTLKRLGTTELDQPEIPYLEQLKIKIWLKFIAFWVNFYGFGSSGTFRVFM